MAAHISYHEAQLSIDEEIANLTARMQMEESIRVLKTRRNELAPVAKIPDEILQQILIILRDSTHSDPQDWHQVTHICRYWRRVAVGSPLLWTRLHHTPPTLIRLMLQRSQGAPLEVVVTHWTDKHSIRVFTIILHELKLIRALTLTYMPPSFPDTIHNILAGLGRDQTQASLLESLAIHSQPSYGPPHASVKAVTDAFRTTGLLRRLTLSSGYHHWSMFPIPSLTHLHLAGESLGEVEGTRFIEAMRQMQNLETLKISWETLNIRHFPPTPRPQPIQLPCLRRLEICNGPQVALESFLSLMMHPKLHQLDIDPYHSGINISTLTKSVLSLMGKASFGPLEYLKICRQWITISTSSETNLYDD
ncbi:hypothetical protein D9619_010032 [Psilocybe cf. subviscida]|uniref:F-box domain-containing protein n=1 Tax=Psilocybe cf. subviscida TaxID=2480587 RepID=A0A8H5BL45_9AGAR|nr:hypothetical protein D9619_010032 [Psilocybe cf. subviscida]